MSLLSSIFGSNKSENIAEYLSKGAQIIDVRSPAEFNSGHAKNSKNIPLDQIGSELNKIVAMKKPIILVCQSGGRASVALNQLKNKGVDAINAGNWSNANT